MFDATIHVQDQIFGFSGNTKVFNFLKNFGKIHGAFEVDYLRGGGYHSCETTLAQVWVSLISQNIHNMCFFHSVCKSVEIIAFSHKITSEDSVQILTKNVHSSLRSPKRKVQCFSRNIFIQDILIILSTTKRFSYRVKQ